MGLPTCAYWTILYLTFCHFSMNDRCLLTFGKRETVDFSQQFCLSLAFVLFFFPGLRSDWTSEFNQKLREAVFIAEMLPPGLQGLLDLKRMLNDYDVICCFLPERKKKLDSGFFMSGMKPESDLKDKTSPQTWHHLRTAASHSHHLLQLPSRQQK